MELPPAPSGQTYTTPNMSSDSYTVWINNVQVIPDIEDKGNGKWTYTIDGAEVQPPGPIIFKDGDTVVATAEITN